jgi:hypothetical protein
VGLTVEKARGGAKRKGTTAVRACRKPPWESGAAGRHYGPPALREGPRNRRLRQKIWRSKASYGYAELAISERL